MLEKNKEYKAITNLRQTIDEAHKLQAKLDDVNKKIAKQEAIELKESHKHFPYGKMLYEKEQTLQYASLLQKATKTLSALICYGFLFALPLGVLYVLDMQAIITFNMLRDETIYLISAIAIYVLLLVFTVLTIKRYVQRYDRWFFDLRDKHYNKKHKTAFNEAYVQTKEMIEDYKQLIEGEINTLETKKEKIESELEHVQKTIENNAQIPKKYIADVDEILTYFEDMRATTTLDAINLYVKEKREQTYFESIQSSLAKQHEATIELHMKLNTLSEIKDSLEKMPREASKQRDGNQKIDEKLGQIKHGSKKNKKQQKKALKQQKKETKRRNKEDKEVEKIEKKRQKDKT